jgi:hypothetical protein
MTGLQQVPRSRPPFRRRPEASLPPHDIPTKLVPAKAGSPCAMVASVELDTQAQTIALPFRSNTRKDPVPSATRLPSESWTFASAVAVLRVR